MRGERQRPGDIGTPRSRRAKQDGDTQSPSLPPTLAELGITKKQASRWQKLAALPRAEREAAIERTKARIRQAVECTAPRRKGKGNSKDNARDEGISRAAVKCAMDLDQFMGKALDKVPVEVLPWAPRRCRNRATPMGYRRPPRGASISRRLSSAATAACDTYHPFPRSSARFAALAITASARR